MASTAEIPFDRIETTLKRVVGALREAGVPFMLAGSLASWARGGPETRHDLDFIVRPDDAQRALDALAAAGMEKEDPIEEWLVKAWDGDVLVDLIHRPSGIHADSALERAQELSVLGMSIPVMALEDLMASKLLSLDDHRLDYSGILQIARALREQIDWDVLRERTRGSPYAAGFLRLAEELGVAPLERSEGARVQVLSSARGAAPQGLDHRAGG